MSQSKIAAWIIIPLSTTVVVGALFALLFYHDPHEARTDMPSDTTESKFHVGEKWSYHTRPGEEGPSVTIVKVETAPVLGVIVHISIDGLRIRNPNAPGFMGGVGHMPFAESAIERSVTTLSARNAPIPNYKEGYLEWRRAFEVGKAGVFSVTIAEGVDFIEKAASQ